MGAPRSCLRDSVSTLLSSLDARLMTGALGAAFCIASWAEVPETLRGDRLPGEWGEEADFSMASGVGKNRERNFSMGTHFKLD